MEYFCKSKNLQDNDNLLDLIKVKTREYIIKDNIYILYTYTLKSQRNKTSDDKIYLENPLLYDILPRSNSILCKYTNGKIKQIGELQGIKKFTGDFLSEDDDYENEYNGITEDVNKRLSSFTKVKGWEKKNELEIIITEKANGKFCLFTLVKDPDDENNILLLGGSKNNHIVLSLNEFVDTKEIDDLTVLDSYLMKSIFKNIYKTVKSFDFALYKLLLLGYSLTGELCDGKHFTFGDQTVKWFGIFKNGKTEDPSSNFFLMKKCNLQLVNYSVVSSNLDQVFLKAKISNSVEGLVIYCRNKLTRECILLKSKSTNYIVKRFVRQIILKGYDKLHLLQDRFIDASNYHCLNTESAIRITHLLHYFVFWLMENKYPTFCVSSMESDKIYTSFYHYWDLFVKKTNVQDLVINQSNFGKFDKDLYKNNTILYNNRDKTLSPIVIFIQGLQGSGKTTIANDLKNNFNPNECIIVEQDKYFGDTLACKGHLYHLISSNKFKYIIVSRCNLNSLQYKSYLDVCMNLNARTLFFTHLLKSPLYVALSLVGIFERSVHLPWGKLQLGNLILDIKQVYTILLKNYHQAQSHNKAIVLKTFTNSESLEYMARSNLLNFDDFLKFVKDNMIELQNLRCNSRQIIQCIQQVLVDPLKHYIYNENHQWNGFFFNNRDKQILYDFIYRHVQIIPTEIQNYKFYGDHITQFYKSKKNQVSNSVVSPFETVNVNIDKMIIRRSDNSIVFNVSRLQSNKDGENIDVSSNLPHITGLLPIDLKPLESLSLLCKYNNDTQSQEFIKIDCDFSFNCTCLVGL